MNDSQYNLLADEIILQIEEAIEDCGTDIDFEGVSGMLTLTFKNGSKVIINKQAPLHEIWVATKFNGHHFQCDSDNEQGQWTDKRGGGELWQFLSKAISLQADTDITISAG
jgi:CyaY protein